MNRNESSTAFPSVFPACRSTKMRYEPSLKPMKVKFFDCCFRLCGQTIPTHTLRQSEVVKILYANHKHHYYNSDYEYIALL